MTHGKGILIPLPFARFVIMAKVYRLTPPGSPPVEVALDRLSLEDCLYAWTFMEDNGTASA